MGKVCPGKTPQDPAGAKGPGSSPALLGLSGEAAAFAEPSSRGDRGRVESEKRGRSWRLGSRRASGLETGVRSVRHEEAAVGLGDWLGAGSKETPSRL